MSQLDHALAKRPTGSIFKPFVYAAAVNTAVTGQAMFANTSSDPNTGVVNNNDGVFTPASLIDDSQVSIAIGGDQVYEPRNYHENFHGEVTARYALAESLNNATVRLGAGSRLRQSCGTGQGCRHYQRARPRRRSRSAPTTQLRSKWPGAYTVFANGGTRLSPLMVKSVRDVNGNVLNNYQSDSQGCAGSARGLRDDHDDGSGGQQRHGISGTRAWIYRAGSRQDRHLA